MESGSGKWRSGRSGMAEGSEWVSAVSRAGGGGGKGWWTVGCSAVAVCSSGPRSPAWGSPSYAVRPRRALGTARGTVCAGGGRGTQKPVSRGPTGGLGSGKGVPARIIGGGEKERVTRRSPAGGWDITPRGALGCSLAAAHLRPLRLQFLQRFCLHTRVLCYDTRARQSVCEDPPGRDARRTTDTGHRSQLYERLI